MSDSAERARIDAWLQESARVFLADAPVALAEPVLYALGGAGKRVRPRVCLAAYRSIAAGNASNPVLDIACALEAVHTYSLVHDDLPAMDDDDLRRGRPTVHRVYGVPEATVAGAVLLILAFRFLERGARALALGTAGSNGLAGTLARAAGATGMIAGQWRDLDAEGRDVAPGELFAIHTAKTGALMGAAAELGGLAGRATGPRLAALRRFGEVLGLAFQIADDVLDETGKPDVLGKTGGRDLALRKATFPGAIGLAGARERAELEAARALQALDDAGLRTAELEALARYAIERER